MKNNTKKGAFETMKNYYDVTGMEYVPGKIQEQVERFMRSGDKENEIVIPSDRTLTSVRGSFDQAIRSTHSRAVMAQNRGHLYIRKY